MLVSMPSQVESALLALPFSLLFHMRQLLKGTASIKIWEVDPSHVKETSFTNHNKLQKRPTFVATKECFSSMSFEHMRI